MLFGLFDSSVVIQVTICTESAYRICFKAFSKC